MNKLRVFNELKYSDPPASNYYYKINNDRSKTQYPPRPSRSSILLRSGRIGRIFLPGVIHGEPTGNSRIFDHRENRREGTAHCPKAISRGSRSEYGCALCCLAFRGRLGALARTTTL